MVLIISALVRQTTRHFRFMFCFLSQLISFFLFSVILSFFQAETNMGNDYYPCPQCDTVVCDAGDYSRSDFTGGLFCDDGCLRDYIEEQYGNIEETRDLATLPVLVQWLEKDEVQLLLGEQQVSKWMDEFKQSTEKISIRIGNEPLCSCNNESWSRSIEERKASLIKAVKEEKNGSEFLRGSWNSVEDFRESWQNKEIFDHDWWMELTKLPPVKSFLYSEEAKTIQLEMGVVKEKVEELQNKLVELQKQFDQCDKTVTQHQCHKKRKAEEELDKNSEDLIIEINLKIVYPVKRFELSIHRLKRITYF